MIAAEVDELPAYQHQDPPSPSADAVQAAVELIKQAKHPCIFAGWGCKDGTAQLQKMSEILQAPVALTMQGFGVFPGTHPLHAGMSFGASAVPAARNAFKDCDCLIAVATRFAEVGTGSYGVTVPPNLIHIDIDATVFDKNYPARVKITGDAAASMEAIIRSLETQGFSRPENTALKEQIKNDKEAYYKTWTETHFRGVRRSFYAP
jgi:acetolactate synthase-1/2/3 large subunit